MDTPLGKCFETEQFIFPGKSSDDDNNYENNIQGNISSSSSISSSNRNRIRAGERAKENQKSTMKVHGCCNYFVMLTLMLFAFSILLLGGILLRGRITTIAIVAPLTSKTANTTSVSRIPEETRSSKKTLKVFILVGQSNMQGHGFMKKRDNNGNFRNGTLEWMIETYPEKYSKLKEKNNSTLTLNSNSTVGGNKTSGAGGNWRQRDDVWIVYNRQENIDNTGPQFNQHGYLVAGYGGDRPQQHSRMGPELGFGYEVGDALNRHNDDDNDEDNNNQKNILLIKIAWGGKSLAVDFRPPSSSGTTGLYYEAVMATVSKTLNELSHLFPNYQSLYGDSGYEISGWVWHQGWNDCKKHSGMAEEYEYNLSNLIRDIRIDLKTPNLPVSIGVSGMQGWDGGKNIETIIAAQFAVANHTKYPEFAGTVQSVETRSYFRNKTQSPGDEKYHWNNNCESYWLIGQSMGKAMVELLTHKK